MAMLNPNTGQQWAPARFPGGGFNPAGRNAVIDQRRNQMQGMQGIMPRGFGGGIGGLMGRMDRNQRNQMLNQMAAMQRGMQPSVMPQQPGMQPSVMPQAQPFSQVGINPTHGRMDLLQSMQRQMGR